MPRHAVFSFLLVAVSLLTWSGCSDPAADKPAAEVGEAVPSTAVAETGERLIFGEGSKIGFIGSKVTGSHEGGFESFQGQVSLVGGDPAASSVHVTIDTTSLWADRPKLTNHLKSPDFFDVATYPTASFHSTAIERSETGYLITGNLDLHGVTKSITFPAEIVVEDGQVRVESEFSIKRFDFGIEYKGMADDLIRDDVVIKLQLVGVPDEA